MAVVGLPGRDDSSAHLAFVERHKLGDLVHIEDTDGALWSYFGVFSQPTWIFFRADGAVTRGRGALSATLFESG